MTIRMVLPIIPTSQMRARSAVRAGHAFAYKAAKQRHAEESLIALMEKHRPEKPIDGAVRLEITAHMPIPQSRSKKWKQSVVWHITRPDADNLLKQVMDCMTQLSFWHDDTQVADVRVLKAYSVMPRWEIILETI